MTMHCAAPPATASPTVGSLESVEAYKEAVGRIEMPEV